MSDTQTTNTYLIVIPGIAWPYQVECTEKEAIADARLEARRRGTSAQVREALTRKVVAIIPQAGA